MPQTLVECEFCSTRPARVKQAQSIVKDIARESQLTVAAIVGDSRSRSIVRARDKAAQRIHLECGLELAAIGRILGGRDHSTIVHALKRAKSLDQGAIQ